MGVTVEVCKCCCSNVKGLCCNIGGATTTVFVVTTGPLVDGGVVTDGATEACTKFAVEVATICSCCSCFSLCGNDVCAVAVEQADAKVEFDKEHKLELEFEFDCGEMAGSVGALDDVECVEALANNDAFARVLMLVSALALVLVVGVTAAAECVVFVVFEAIVDSLMSPISFSHSALLPLVLNGVLFRLAFELIAGMSIVCVSLPNIKRSRFFCGVCTAQPLASVVSEGSTAACGLDWAAGTPAGGVVETSTFILCDNSSAAL